MTEANRAASSTLRVMGPAVSWVEETGSMPSWLIRPTVGLCPTTEFDSAGSRMEPEVSVPTVAAARPTEAATPEPELEPLGDSVTS